MTGLVLIAFLTTGLGLGIVVVMSAALYLLGAALERFCAMGDEP